ncbi:SRSO17 transposase [Saccharothrix saharensis]|uniref:SRSO17 transposase n=1 Tax=Saccharothrix saharensis TaxID=571190 RepID=A0A543JAJ4_9PSEU|nr:SRSO17 transposase [Saccharothrix saharensis]
MELQTHLAGGVRAFAHRMFQSMPRADQRRWAEIYLSGLVNAAGRKSISKIAELAGGGSAVQSLQQFVNQSPWDWQPVREALALYLAERLPVRAWLLGYAVIHKRGDHSVGVERRFVRDAGRLVNCQLGLSLQLDVGETAVPVNWRLLLSRRWTEDAERRRRTRIPEHEGGICEREHMLGMLDELITLRVPTAPVVFDATDVPNAHRLLDDLTDRGLGYVIGVKGDERILAEPHLRAVMPTRQADQRVGRRALSPSEILRGWRDHPSSHRVWPGLPGHGAGRVQVRAASARLVDTERRPGSPVRLVAERPLGSTAPTRYWITNLVDRPVPELFDLITRKDRADANAARDPYGLHDFEGRSYQGWHHHMTMVSVAHAYALLTGANTDDADYLSSENATS